MLDVNRRARFSIIQKYNDGHKNRSQYTAIGKYDAKIISFSSLKIAFRISSAICSGLEPVAVLESVTICRKKGKNSKFYGKLNEKLEKSFSDLTAICAPRGR